MRGIGPHLQGARWLGNGSSGYKHRECPTRAREQIRVYCDPEYDEVRLVILMRLTIGHVSTMAVIHQVALMYL